MNNRLLYWCLNARLLKRCLKVRLLEWCLNVRLLIRCLKIRLLGCYSHRLRLKSLHWLSCLKRHWRLLGQLAYWLLSHHYWLLRGHKALH